MLDPGQCQISTLSISLYWRLSRSVVPGFLQPEEACNYWILPTLQRKVIECSFTNVEDGAVQVFDEETSKWLKRFSELAVRRKQAGTAFMAEVEAIYYEEDEKNGTMDVDTRQMFEDLRGFITQLGLTFILSYVPEEGGEKTP
jgi:hypothetical protein